MSVTASPVAETHTNTAYLIVGHGQEL